MKKIKTFIQDYAIGFTIGILFCGIIAVYAATYFPSNQTTYDNTNTKLQSENVQDAIDELYGVCFPSAADQIIEEAGLEKDPYECRYFFTGANPNNYITFNDETNVWRITSIECDGTIKITRTADIGSRAWDTSNNNDWSRPSSLNKYLNNNYYNDLSVTSQKQIIAKDWSIGAITRNNNNLEQQINDENSKIWQGKIGLLSLSEYLRANSNIELCGTIELDNDNRGTCAKTNWLVNSSEDYWRTLSSSDANNYDVFSVLTSGGINDYDADYFHVIRPALYLSSEVTLTGSGTQSDPYVVS